MSTIVVVHKENEIVIGADTLTKYGESKEPAEFVKNYSKIIEIGDSYFAFVGHASFGLVLQSYLQGLDEIPPLGNKLEIFEMARKMHPVLKKNYFMVANDEDSFEGSEVDCLVINKSGIYGLYSMQNVHQFSKFYAFGSGSQYAVGAMHGLYNGGSQAREIAEAGLAAAVTFDDASEGPVELRTITV